MADEIVEKIARSMARADFLGEPLRMMFDIDPSIAEEVGVNLVTSGKWSGFSDVAGDEQEDTVAAILKPCLAAALKQHGFVIVPVVAEKKNG